MFATACSARPLLQNSNQQPAGEHRKTGCRFDELDESNRRRKQFWADVWFFHDWRIQCHALTGHYRLLDGSNRRHASGTYEQCRDKMDEIRTRDKLPPMEGKAIIVLHGLFRTRSSMATLGGGACPKSGCL